MKSSLGEILGLIFILAVITMLVRPNSLGPKLVSTAGQALSDVITFAVSS